MNALAAAVWRVRRATCCVGAGRRRLPNGVYVPGTIEAETHCNRQKVGSILKAAGCSWDDRSAVAVIKSTVHLADIADFTAYNELYASYFPGIKPARTTVQSGLGHGIKVEIDGVAKVP